MRNLAESFAALVVALALMAGVVFVVEMTISNAQAKPFEGTPEMADEPCSEEAQEPNDGNVEDEAPEEPSQEPQEDDSDYIFLPDEYTTVYYDSEPYSGSGGSEGLTAFTGVNYHDGRRETYYSSNVLYHKDTSDWTADSEGFYRTDEGYYVVAASDKPQGSTFEGSKGTCIVLDSGCPDGTTDYYVNWR